MGRKNDNNSLIEKINNYENSLSVEISRSNITFLTEHPWWLLLKGQDAIDILLHREGDNIHVRGYCLEVNQKASYSCSSCSVSFKTFRDREELYENISSCHPEKAPHIKLREIINTSY